MQPIPPASTSGPAGRSNPAQLGGILILVCSAMILLGTCSRGWITQSRGDSSSGLGLMGYKFCYEGHCEGKWFESKMSKGADADITAARYLAFLGGLGAAVMAGLTGALALGRNARKAPLLGVYIVCGVAAFFGIYFIGRVLSEMHGSHTPGPGWSFFVSFLGLVGAAVIAGVMIRPAARAEAGLAPAGYGGGYPGGGYPQPFPGAMPMGAQQAAPMGAQPAAPMCPRCGPAGQVTFAAQYQRHFCGRCQQYV